MVNHARRKLPPPRTVRCLGPGPEHTFTSRDGERVCPGCRKRERERDGHLVITGGAARPGRLRLVIAPAGVTGATRWAEGRDYVALGCCGNEGAGRKTLHHLKARTAAAGAAAVETLPRRDGAAAARGGAATKGKRKPRRTV